MRAKIREFRDLLTQNPDLKRGCVVDTNALFAATMPLDRLNGWAEKVFSTLHDKGVPIFSNLNIRSEFIELNRRVLVPEGLVSYYDASLDVEMDKELRTQLKLLKVAKDKATEADTLYRFNDQQLKKFRSLMMGLGKPAAGKSAWEGFCDAYLHPYLSVVWDAALSALKVQFLGTREIESGEYFTKRPSWTDMTDIVGRYGISAADAMIVNFFLCSRFKVLITGDEDVAYVIERIAPDTRYALVCEKEELQ